MAASSEESAEQGQISAGLRPLVHCVSEQHGPLLRAQLPPKGLCGSQGARGDLPALLESLSKPHPKDEGQAKRFVPSQESENHKRPEATIWRSFDSAVPTPSPEHRPRCALKIPVDPRFHWGITGVNQGSAYTEGL